MQKLFTAIFTNGMQSIKPQATDPTLISYNDRLEAWSKAFAFSTQLRDYVNSLCNMIVNAGQSNTSAPQDTITADAIALLQTVPDSTDFQNNMNLAKPILSPTDPKFSEEMALWNTAFYFSNDLQTFMSQMKALVNYPGNNNQMPLSLWMAKLNSFIDDESSKLPADLQAELSQMWNSPSGN